MINYILNTCDIAVELNNKILLCHSAHENRICYTQNTYIHQHGDNISDAISSTQQNYITQ